MRCAGFFYFRSCAGGTKENGVGKFRIFWDFWELWGWDENFWDFWEIFGKNEIF